MIFFITGLSTYLSAFIASLVLGAHPITASVLGVLANYVACALLFRLRMGYWYFVGIGRFGDKK